MSSKPPAAEMIAASKGDAKGGKVPKTRLDGIEASILRGDEVLEILLTGDNLGSRGAARLAEVLPRCQSLKRIDLKGVRLGESGALALIPALESLKNLVHLDISSNNIPSSCLAPLGEALKSVTGLRTLDLRSNRIDDDGVVALLPAIKCLRQLRDLRLGDNSLSDDSSRALAPILKLRKSLAVSGLKDLDKIVDAYDPSSAVADTDEAVSLRSTATQLDERGNVIGGTTRGSVLPDAPPPPPGGMQGWSVRQVSQWLCSIDMPEYVDAFSDARINGLMLAEGLTAEDYKDLGVVRIHSRRMDVEIARALRSNKA